MQFSSGRSPMQPTKQSFPGPQLDGTIGSQAGGVSPVPGMQAPYALWFGNETQVRPATQSLAAVRQMGRHRDVPPR